MAAYLPGDLLRYLDPPREEGLAPCDVLRENLITMVKHGYYRSFRQTPLPRRGLEDLTLMEVTGVIEEYGDARFWDSRGYQHGPFPLRWAIYGRLRTLAGNHSPILPHLFRKCVELRAYARNAVIFTRHLTAAKSLWRAIGHWAQASEVPSFLAQQDLLVTLELRDFVASLFIGVGSRAPARTPN